MHSDTLVSFFFHFVLSVNLTLEVRHDQYMFSWLLSTAETEKLQRAIVFIVDWSVIYSLD